MGDVSMKNKDKFRMRVSIVTQYENTTHSIVIKYNDDPTCNKVLQDFVDALLDYGYHEESILKAVEAVTI
jgi:hypothetical protein